MGVMDERSSRVFVGVCLLVLVWIGTYWVYEPGDRNGDLVITSGNDRPSEPHPLPEPTPDPVVSPPAEPEREEPAIESEPPPPAVEGGVVIPPEFRIHTIRANESMESIARLYFGSDADWRVIAKSNPLKDPRRLRVGETLRVPVDPGNIQGKLFTGDGDDPPVDAGPIPDPVVEYVVQPGDALTKIAKRYYGSSRHADFIFESNRDVLRSPDAIRVGQTLRLPPLPAQGEESEG